MVGVILEPAAGTCHNGGFFIYSSILNSLLNHFTAATVERDFCCISASLNSTTFENMDTSAAFLKV